MVPTKSMNSALSGRHSLYLLFAVSGFAGLIYESVWTHYLKLFLGHAAYAQTLVLVIFMGGMAIGAWLPSRYGARLKNLLLAYAVAELAIGLLALSFHGLFIRVTDFAYDVLIPEMGSPLTAGLLTWSLGALLVLPPSILLGATFPLMSAGLLRRHPGQPGHSVAMLYFTNSIGATFGVLASGFVLIDRVGLPGTVFTAGLLNIGLALIVWLIARSAGEPQPKRNVRPAETRTKLTPWQTMLVAAFVTGAASFMYEIGWIRMLSLVLGTSNHAFELMLSAFILGLAFGGLWIRNRIDGLRRPAIFLGWVQVAMGTLAVATLPAYNLSFDIMQTFMQAVARTDSGYGLFNVVSHALAAFIMVPVTFCAGMTLPLITSVLLKEGHGEKSIGAVYAANTLGAIAGVLFAVHIGLPGLGLQGTITAGAALDMLLGVALLGTAINLRKPSPAIALSCMLLVLVYSSFGIELDRYKMVSGVYRYGRLLSPESTEVMYHKDGKTATVNLLQVGDDRSITTNGKPDAQINMRDEGPVSTDEVTMTLAGALSIIMKPDAKRAANIGMGSGLTTHVMLSGSTLERLDTIEIEPAMIEAARGFGHRVEAAFKDPRSRFHIDDARAFFSINKDRYDVIVSEPSNPWVSGVANLFSDEFYRRVRIHLNSGGIFIQWLQLYEIDALLVASVLKAIGQNFQDYMLYITDSDNLLIVAAKDGVVPSLSARGFAVKGLAAPLERIGIKTMGDLRLHQLGDRRLFEPFFNAMPTPLNSDFFPVLDRGAARARFLDRNAMELGELDVDPIPAFEMLSGVVRDIGQTYYIDHAFSDRSRRANTALAVRDFFANGTLSGEKLLDSTLMRQLLLLQQLQNACAGQAAKTLWQDGIRGAVNALMPYVKASDMKRIVAKLRTSACYPRLTPTERDLVALYDAVGQRDARRMAALAGKLLERADTPEQGRFLLAAGMLGNLALGKALEAQQLWDRHATRSFDPRSSNILLRFLLAHSISQTMHGGKQLPRQP